MTAMHQLIEAALSACALSARGDDELNPEAAGVTPDRKIVSTLSGLVLATSLAASGTASAQSPQLYVYGQPGPDQVFYVGTFSATGESRGASDSIQYFHFGDLSEWFNIDFAGAKPGGFVQEALPSMNAGRAPLRPGLNRLAGGTFTAPKFPILNLEHRGATCHGESAIYVYESEAAADGTPTKLAFDFSHACNDAGFRRTLPLAGSFRLNSTVPLVLDRVYAVADYERAVLAGAPTTVFGGRSWGMKAPIVTYSWSQVSGPAVDLADCQSATCTFAAPLVSPGGQDVVLDLSVRDADGRTDSDRLTLHVRHRGDEQTMVKLNGTPGGWLLGFEQWIYFSEFDGNLLVCSCDSGTDSFTYNFGSVRDLGLLTTRMKAALGQLLVSGTYSGATQDSFDTSRPYLLFGYDHRNTQYDGALFKIHALDWAGSAPSMPARLGLYSRLDYTYFGPQQARSAVWLNYKPPAIPTASLKSPVTVAPGQTFVLDASSSISTDGGPLGFNLFQTKGPLLQLVDESSPGRWTVSLPSDAAAGSTIQVTLEVEDGYSAADVRSIHVAAPPPPGGSTTPSSGGGGAMGGVWLVLLILACVTLSQGEPRRTLDAARRRRL